MAQEQESGSSAIAPSIECMNRLNRSSTSVSAWLNSELSHASGSSGTSDGGVSNLESAVQPLRQLSLSLAAVRDQSRIEMEQLISSLVATIPGLAVELSLMSENVKALDHRIRSLQSSTNSPNGAAIGAHANGDDGQHALAQIATLSRTKAQMIAARHTLREAQSWTTLEAEFAAMTGDNRFEEAVQRLVNARNSLRLFQQAANPATGPTTLPNSSFSMQERSELLLKLTTDIEAKLVPALEQALVDRDSASTIRLASLFVQLDSVEQTFMPTYLRARSGDVLLKWSRRFSAASNTSTRNHLVAHITGLLSDSMALLGEERIFAAKIFSDPKRAAQLLLSHVLSHLEPSLDSCIAHAAQVADTDAEQFLSDLTETWRVVDDSFRSFADILAPEPQQQDAATRPISLASQSADSDWRRKMLEPFLPYHAQFAQLEAQAMRVRLEQTSFQQTSISARVSRAIKVTKSGMRRTAEFTNSVALAAVLPHIEQILASVLDQCRQSEEEEGRKLLRDVEDRIRRSYTNSHLSVGGGTSAGGGMVDERAESLTQAEWEQFRARTNKLAECRTAFDALNELEVAIARQLADVNVPQPSSERDFTSPAKCIATSALNSAQLHDSIAAAKRRLLLLQNTSAALTTAASQEALLPYARESLAALTRSLHQTQHALVLTPFTQTDLQSYPTLAIWRSNKRPGLPANEYDLAMPKFSLSPTDQMARIGEAMLNLPRLFEGLADDALLFGLQLHHLPKRRGEPATGAARSDTHARHRKAFSMAEAPDATGQRDSDHADNGGEDGDDDSADEDDENAADPTARILTRYLRSLLRAFFAHLLGTTLPQLASGGPGSESHARPLSEIGTSQLAADLEYLSNITSVLWSPSERVLAPYRQCVEMPDATGKRLLEHRRLDTTLGDADQEYTLLISRDSAALDLIATLQGWNTP